MSSFFPDAITSWNNIITYFGDIPTIDKLKDHILSLVRPKRKCVFGIHDPLCLRYLFQLRVSLSPLRRHKKRYNFIDTPSDKCHCNHGIEDSKHFLFSCPIFATQRVTLMTSVNSILHKYNLNHLGNNDHLYLYGHETLTFAENKLIILSTLKYIKETGRFAT